MTGLWEPGWPASLLAFLTELDEESGLLDEEASLEPRRCFGVESIIPKWSRPFRVYTRERVKRGDSYWSFETTLDAQAPSKKGKRVENCAKLYGRDDGRKNEAA